MVEFLCIAEWYYLCIFCDFHEDAKRWFPLGLNFAGTYYYRYYWASFSLPVLPSTSGWIFLLILGVFQLGIPHILYSAAIKKATALEAVLISIVEPILNPVLVFMALGEAPGIFALLGGTIVLVSITLKCVLTIMPLKTVTEDKKEQTLE